MALYGGYLIGPDGSVVGRCEFEREDDLAALEYARRNVMGKPIELWEGERLVGRVEPADRRKSRLASFLGDAGD